MQKLIYLVIGCAAGILIGFISFTIYFEPLLRQETGEMARHFKASIPTGYAKNVSDSALSSANIAFHSQDYDASIRIIGNELSLASNAIKYGAPQQGIPLTISMLGACLAKSNSDAERATDFEGVATSVCRSWSAMNSCEITDLYNFVRTYAKTDKC